MPLKYLRSELRERKYSSYSGVVTCPGPGMAEAQRPLRQACGDSPGAGREKPRVALDPALAGLHEQEAAGATSRLGLARLGAELPGGRPADRR